MSTMSASASILGPQWLHLPLLTMGVMGLQIVWSVEMSYGWCISTEAVWQETLILAMTASPYLLELGLAPALMSLVFIAGPLSGLIVQPLVGSLSDNSKSKWGRRRPFIVIGTVFCVAGMALLGFTRQFANIFTASYSKANNILTIALATISIFIIDFSINAVQAMDRALIVDTLPTSRQEIGNAWASRMIGVGHVLGFFIGNITLTSWPSLSIFGRTQLQIFSVITSIILAATHAVTVCCVKESGAVHSNIQSTNNLITSVREIWRCMMTLPGDIRHICMIQFFSWMAWFPVLFFSTVYVGELYNSSNPIGSLNDQGTIRGARALLFNSLLALFTSVVLPVVSSVRLQSRDKPRFHLATLWTTGHLVFAVSMGLTFLPPSWQLATVMVAVTGYSFAITEWAPYALIAKCLLTTATEEVDDRQALLSDGTSTPRHRYDQNAGFSEGDRDTANINEQDNAGHATGSQTGLILGIHNISIVLPQFVMTGVTSVVFAIMDPSRAVDVPSRAINTLNFGAKKSQSLAVIYRIAGVSALTAAFLSWKLSNRLKRSEYILIA